MSNQDQMTGPDERFREIARQLREGMQPDSQAVRTVLSWYGFQRRSAWIVATIRAALEAAGLETVPDIDSTYLDGDLRFILREEPAAKLNPTSPVETVIETI